MLVRLAPFAPVRIDVVPFGQLRWQIAPLTTRAKQVQHCTEHLVQIELDRFGAASNAAQQRLDLGKFLSTDVAWVRLSFHPRIVEGKEIVNTLLEQQEAEALERKRQRKAWDATYARAIKGDQGRPEGEEEVTHKE